MIDILTVIVIAYAIFKGYSKGLIVAVFSFVGFIVGLAAAVKLSAVVAGWLKTNSGISQQLMPTLAFALVFIATVFLVRMGANIIERTVKFAMLGWVNKIGGIVLFLFLYLSVLSIALFYVDQLGIIKKEQFAASVLYPYYSTLGQTLISSIGTVLPWFKDIFEDLKTFFGSIAPTKL
jgi:membrane protein required for colicin V production